MENKKKKNFFTRNIYYFLIGFVLVAAVTVTAVMVRANANKVPTNKIESSDVDGNSEGISSPDDPVTDLPGDSSSGDKADNNNDNDKPVSATVVFTMPVDDGVVINDYTGSTVAYNKTLNIYTGHLAIDFAADEGSAVKAVYDGRVESVTTTYLTGTTVTITHSDGLKTVYNSIDAADNLKAGDSVKQGDVIGYVTDNNRQEYKDGPHLHFEVYKNGEKINPYEYLLVEGK